MSSPGISLEQLVSTLQRKSIPLPFEMGTFLVLEACERVLQAPAKVTAGSVWLSAEGEVAVIDAPRAQPGDACRSLVVLLGELLVRSAPGVPQMLLTLVEEGPSDGEWSLPRLRDDLEASLVPLNRAATRRVLGRLLREVHREGGDRGAVSRPDHHALDGELDVLLGVEPGTEPPPPPPELDSELESELDAARQPAKQGHDGPRSTVAARPGAAARQPLHEPEVPRLREGLDEFERASEGSGRGGLWLGVVLIVLAAVLAAAYLLLGRDRARAALGVEGAPSAAQAATPKPPQAPAREAAPGVGRLEVDSAPIHAQVLLGVGESPTEVTGLPVGQAHEFVALSPGHAPVRAVVPVDAAWQEGATAGALRFELAMQLSPATGEGAAAERAAEELGATLLPRELGRPGADRGSVRITTSPPGASIYQLVGFTPDARVDNLPLDQEHELLVYLGGHQLVRERLGADDFSPADGGRLARLDVKLETR